MLCFLPLNFNRLNANADEAPTNTDTSATKLEIISEFLAQVKYGIAGLLNRVEKFVMENSVGKKLVTLRLPELLKEDRTTK